MMADVRDVTDVADLGGIRDVHVVAGREVRVQSDVTACEGVP